MDRISAMRNVEEALARFEDGECDLDRIYVAPDRWGDGIGSALFERGVASVPSHVDRVKIRVLAANDATRFYERLGCRRVGTVPVEADGDRYAGLVYAFELAD